MSEIDLRAARRTIARCAICHDEEGRLDRCLDCDSRAHTDCAEGLDRCPTLGCQGEFQRLPPTWVALGQAAWLASMVAAIGAATFLHQIGLALLLGCFGGLALGATWGPVVRGAGSWAARAAVGSLGFVALVALGAPIRAAQGHVDLVTWVQVTADHQDHEWRSWHNPNAWGEPGTVVGALQARLQAPQEAPRSRPRRGSTVNVRGRSRDRARAR